MLAIYNSWDTSCKTPFGAVPAGTQLCFTLRVPKSYGCTTPFMFISKDGAASPSQLPLTKTGKDATRDIFTLLYTPEETALYFYWFDLWVHYRKLFKGDGGECVETTGEGQAYQLTVYNPGYKTPSSMWGGVMYQIFPDRFFQGQANKKQQYSGRIYRKNKNEEPYFWPDNIENGFLTKDYFGGDLPGIEKKLPYLAALGVTLIYLNPIFEAHANHRYNTANYMQVDKDLGSNQDFARLCKKAKKKGIRIILDGVFSHTGADSIYFNKQGRYNSPGAFQSETSPYRSWFNFDANGGYRSWWGFETLPECNKNSPSFRNFICGQNGVVQHWLRLGAAGWRLDVADELPDDFIQNIRSATKNCSRQALLLGEVWEDATTKYGYGARRQYFAGQGLDAVMNYPFTNAILAFARSFNAAAFMRSVMQICENYPPPALNCCTTHLSTHDTVRALTQIMGEELNGQDRNWQSARRLAPALRQAGIVRLGLAFVLQFTLPGIPCVYYGDEIGMEGYKDPFNRCFFQWNNKETRLKKIMVQLAKLRKKHSALANGSLVFHQAQQGLLVYQRANSEESLVFAINASSKHATANLHGKTKAIAPMQWAYSWQKM